ncbi:acetyl-CoA carboxylase [Halegenticoccus tardaugens]|uniref:acetyl-CoA carboxylase n=1 Tax=Halegenticoccus tardaugens TaxID=2071624 RepID=UPI00100A31AC|nr:acetyl-CoA carboxylase [Halegenticoccus tardaugens]
MSEETTITAPMPGVFYRRPNPDDASFVEEGDRVEAGDVVGLIGVMKNFHEITADAPGVVREILVGNEEAIEAGQALVRIDAA